MASAQHHKDTHSAGIKHAPNPVEYERSISQRGLNFERPPFTFWSEEREPQAKARMSAGSAGYVIGNAGTGETAKKNRAAFYSWSIGEDEDAARPLDQSSWAWSAIFDGDCAGGSATYVT